MCIRDSSVDYRYALALLRGELNQPAEALIQLRKIVDLDPSLMRAWYNLGLAYAQLEQLDEAAKALLEANKIEPSAETYFALATIHLRQEKTEEAVQAAEAALRLDPNHRAARALLRQSI